MPGTSQQAKKPLRFVYTAILGIVARHRAVTSAVVSTVGSAAAGFAFTASAPLAGILALAATVLLLLLTGAVSGRYAAADLLTFMLPAIARQISLREGERITVHAIRSIKNQQFEQLTEYWPITTRKTRGRIYTFSYGIVGQCFQNREMKQWSVPVGMTLEDAMRERLGFTPEQRASVTSDRMSFFAYPVGQEGPYAQAVIYVDSPERIGITVARAAKFKKNIDEVFMALLAEALRRA